ncbi:hypothetical protein B0H17DRAFT_1210424 [Mycena rosella]|uniref:Uncharacterized protein n=1 Tax=Mycena rosella TaxID=1033263 RepID=A0AAD7D054_MYCRO|nr:hypothetical protein B0H17DRAFT_1210424 [Mycena rosella]
MSTTSTYFKEGPLPSLSKDEEDTLDLVIYNVEIAAEEYNVDELERSIHQVWEVALHIGVKHGQREARQAHTNTTKELEQERVWGFDLGWKLCSEQLQLCAPQASLNRSSSSSLRSLSVAATQTDAVAAAPVVVASPAPVHLDWAQDAEALQVSPREPEFLMFPPTISQCFLPVPRSRSRLCSGVVDVLPPAFCRKNVTRASNLAKARVSTFPNDYSALPQIQPPQPSGTNLVYGLNQHVVFHAVIPHASINVNNICSADLSSRYRFVDIRAS